MEFEQLQSDSRVRVVHPNNLRAMCERISGTCHRFSVEFSTRFARVTYSNPNEYGSESPMTALFPLVPMHGGMCVMMDVHKVEHDSWDGEGWQAFHILMDCPSLWRTSYDSEDWRTREEIETAQGVPDTIAATKD